MPEEYIPNHFLSWLTYGPAADNQHPLWLPDTGKAILKPKADILEPTVLATSIGKSSNYSRKAQRLEAQKSGSKVLDLTQSDDVANGLLRASVNNSSQIVSLLKSTTDPEKINIDAIVLNACKMYELDNNEENKSEYINALKQQRELLNRRASTPIAPVVVAVKQEDIDCGFDFDDVDVEYEGIHNLDNSFTGEFV